MMKGLKKSENNSAIWDRERDRQAERFTWVEGGFSELRVPPVWVGAHAAAPMAGCMQGQHRQGQSEGQG